MTDRRTMITGTHAGQAFPRLATFLAEQTALPPAAAEEALRAACADYGSAEAHADTSSMWKLAVDNANASVGLCSAPGVATMGEHKGTWSSAVETANRSIGAI